MSKHTPGKVWTNGNIILSYGDLMHLVACWNACDGINPEAVPDLVKACEGVVARFGPHMEYTDGEARAIRACAAALAKAREAK